jgi:hypothetical protein
MAYTTLEMSQADDEVLASLESNQGCLEDRNPLDDPFFSDAKNIRD